MNVVCMDLEGVFIPEIWIKVAEITGIEKLKLTTREISDYNKLMTMRIDTMNEHGLKMADIQNAISQMDPLPGAVEFIKWVRNRAPLIILSDTFEQFAAPLLEKLTYPTIFCNTLTISEKGVIEDFHIRLQDGKRKTAEAFKNLNFKVVASGDSYNDITMLKVADKGVLFRPPQNIIDEYPEIPVAESYEELKPLFLEAFIA